MKMTSKRDNAILKELNQAFEMDRIASTNLVLCQKISGRINYEIHFLIMGPTSNLYGILTWT